MKQRRQVLRRTERRWQRPDWGDLAMRRNNPHKHRTIVVKFEFFDSVTGVEAAISTVAELMRQIESLQQQQHLSEFTAMLEIDLRLNFRASEEATALVAQAIDNSAYQLEALKQENHFAPFVVKYEFVTSNHSQRDRLDDF